MSEAKPFKSRSNKLLTSKVERDASRLYDILPFVIPINESIIITVPFSKVFNQVPMVSIHPIYDEPKFALTSQIVSISNKEFVIALQNIDLELPIKGRIQWYAYTK